jgi:hypothetical protein
MNGAYGTMLMTITYENGVSSFIPTRNREQKRAYQSRYAAIKRIGRRKVSKAKREEQECIAKDSLDRYGTIWYVATYYSIALTEIYG